MNKMKQVLAILILSVVMMPLVKAQDGNQNASSKSLKKSKLSSEQRATALTDTLKNVTGLSAEQYAKVYAANLKFITQKEALRSQGTADKEAVKKMMKELSASRKSEVAAILTPGQLQKWQEWKQARKAQFKGNHPSPSGKVKSSSDNDHLFDETGEM